MTTGYLNRDGVRFVDPAESPGDGRPRDISTALHNARLYVHATCPPGGWLTRQLARGIVVMVPEVLCHPNHLYPAEQYVSEQGLMALWREGTPMDYPPGTEIDATDFDATDFDATEVDAQPPAAPDESESEQDPASAGQDHPAAAPIVHTAPLVLYLPGHPERWIEFGNQGTMTP